MIALAVGFAIGWFANKHSWHLKIRDHWIKLVGHAKTAFSKKV